MTTLFGQFIVEKGLLPKEQVLEALIYQIASRSSLAEIVYDNALLGIDEQLKILAYQQYSGSDYKNSAETLGFWTPEIESQTLLLDAKKGPPPLGEVLVRLGFFSISQMTLALQEFVENREASRRTRLETDRAQSKTFNRPEWEIAEQLSSFVKDSLAPKLRKIQINLGKSSSGFTEIDRDLLALLEELKALRALTVDFEGNGPSDVAERAINAVRNLLGTKWDWEKISRVSMVLRLNDFLLQYLEIHSYYLLETHTESLPNEDVNLKDIYSRLNQTIEDLVRPSSET
jgi:hypothetical protein